MDHQFTIDAIKAIIKTSEQDGERAYTHLAQQMALAFRSVASDAQAVTALAQKLMREEFNPPSAEKSVDKPKASGSRSSSIV